MNQSSIRDEQQLSIRTDGQDWLVSWHPPPTAPSGSPHGAAGICVTGNDQIVLISSDGVEWGFPGGRPEGNETWEQTLRREMREEACATVLDARLLGFCRGCCVTGPEEGLVLVRSFWWARVVLDVWEPAFEIPHRRTAPAAEVLCYLSSDVSLPFLPIFWRALDEAGVLAS